jgi:acyl-CoA thioester hydrolase
MSDCVLPVRVYLEDTDAQGVVYNASYLRFMERARTEWLRACGLDHENLKERNNVLLVLSAISIRFTAPARLDDMLYVYAAPAEVRGARVVFDQRVCRNAADGELVCSGRAEVACMDAGSGRPRRLPAALTSELQV